MPAPKKLSLEFKLNSSSPLFQFIEWYEAAYRKTNPETGRKRKGDAKGAILGFLEEYIKGEMGSPQLGKFNEAARSFQEDNKLPKELQSAKNSLSPDEYKNFKLYWEKIKKDNEKEETN